jgi:DNA polymerase-3 subunit delta
VPTQKPEQLDAAISSGKLGTLYLFDGPENFLKERAVEKITDRLLPVEARDFNLNRFDGNTSAAGDVVAAINSLPFLSERRLIIVRAAHEFSAADQRLIGEALTDLSKSICVVFLYDGKANLREEIPAQSASNGSIITFWTPFESQLPAWITTEAKRKGKAISWDAGRLLAESCSDLQEISNELDKLVLLVGKRPSITLQDVVAQGLPDQTGDYNDLEEAIWGRQLTDALTQSDRLSIGGTSAEAVLPVYERVFRTLLLGHYYTQVKKMRLDEAMNELGLRGKMQQMKFEKGIKAYRPVETEEGLETIAQADYDLKTGALPSRMVLSLLTMKLLKKAS